MAGISKTHKLKDPTRNQLFTSFNGSPLSSYTALCLLYIQICMLNISNE